MFLQPQKIARRLKFWLKEVEDLYHLHVCSENKGFDLLHGYCAADLRLCFHICKKGMFSRDVVQMRYCS